MDDKRARFEAQVQPHLDAAYRFARWLSPAPGEADDVVQEAILRAFRGFDALRGSDVKAWLLTIVRNCHFTALKQEQRRGLVPLPEEHREVLILREIEDMDYREIAAVTNVPLGTVMSRLARARAALKKQWLRH